MTVYSDDPAWCPVRFIFRALAQALGLTREQARELVVSSIRASFAAAAGKQALRNLVEEFDPA